MYMLLDDTFSNVPVLIKLGNIMFSEVSCYFVSCLIMYHVMSLSDSYVYESYTLCDITSCTLSCTISSGYHPTVRDK
jgi:hypothetical protein